MIEIPASKMTQLSNIAAQYHDLVTATLSIGVGVKISEASKALLVAKSRGGNQVVLWQPEMVAEIEAIKQKTENEKISDEYLFKSKGGFTPKDQHAGFAGHSHGSRVMGTQGDHDSAKVLEHQINSADIPSTDVASTASAGPAVDFENQFHLAAQSQSQQDSQANDAQESHTDDVRQEIAKTLTTLRDQMPNLLQMRQSQPDVYKAVMDLVQGVIMLGREVVGQPQPEPVQKSEDDLAKGLQDIPSGKLMERKMTPSSTPGAKVATIKSDFTHLLPHDAQKQGFKLHVEHNTHLPAAKFNKEIIRATLMAPNKQSAGTVYGHVYRNKKNPEMEPHSHLDEGFRGRGLGTAMYEAVFSHAKSQGVKKIAGDVQSADAAALHNRLAKKHGFKYKANPIPGVTEQDFNEHGVYPYGSYSYALKSEIEPGMGGEPAINEDEIFGPGHGVIFYRDDEDELEKADLPGTEHHHLLTPPGTQKGNKVKVTHSDGGTGWKEAGAGMVQAQDPGVPLIGQNSHPVSSRNPSGN
jgi:GNAT superfamily N-acetyltransferase